MQPTHQIPLKKVSVSTRLEGSTEPIWSNFYSHEIPSSLILNAIHLEELHLLSTVGCYAEKRLTSKSFKEEDHDRLNLQIRGQAHQLPLQPERKQLPEVISRNRTLYNSNIKKIRTFLNEQQTTALQTLNSRQQATELHEKFEQLKRYQQAKLSKIKEQTLQRTEQKETVEPKEQEAEFYEKMILKTPSLFNRIVTAYNKQKYDAARQTANRSLKPKTRASNDKRRSVPSVVETQPIINPELVKLQKFKELNFLMALSNNLLVNATPPTLLPTEHSVSYKAYICRGNNGVLVKGMLKTRPWWNIVPLTEVANSNLTWTEWKRGKSFELLSEGQKHVFNETPGKQTLQASFNEKVTLINKVIRLERYPNLRLTVRPQQMISVFSFSKKLTESNRLSEFVQKFCPDTRFLTAIDSPQNQMLLNHFEGGLHLHSKKLLYLNLKQYYKATQRDVWEVLPVTYIVRNGTQDPEFAAFADHYREIQQQQSSTQRGQRADIRRSYNIWICKPGENSNRGNGIYLHDSLDQIQNLVKSREGTSRSLIIQKYIDYPFLYQRRKFDLRCYLLLTNYNGILKGYWFDEGYIRTSSREFTLKHLDNRIIHLTNDAVQKRSDEYGKFESSNKISMADFQKYLDSEHAADKYSVADVFRRMKLIATDIVRSVEHLLSPNNRQCCFELFGLDFMIDSKFRPLLIEANSNPCLEVSGSVLGRLIPSLVENVLRLAVDPLFPPPDNLVRNSKKLGTLTTLESNKFELIFDQQFESAPAAALTFSTRLLSQPDIEEQQEPEQQ